MHICVNVCIRFYIFPYPKGSEWHNTLGLLSPPPPVVSLQLIQSLLDQQSYLQENRVEILQKEAGIGSRHPTSLVLTSDGQALPQGSCGLQSPSCVMFKSH